MGVVRIQLDSLQHNDDPLPNTGLATFYSFMEPSVRDGLGSLTEYSDAMRSSIYADLLIPSKFAFGPMRIQENLAQQTVEIIPSKGQEAMYIFTLALQEDGPYAGCWMNHNVVRYSKGKPQLGSE